MSTSEKHRRIQDRWQRASATLEALGLRESGVGVQFLIIDALLDTLGSNLLAGPSKLSIRQQCCHSYMFYTQALGLLYSLLSPGAVVIVDHWHCKEVCRAVLGYRQKYHWGEALLPIPEDYVHACRQGEQFDGNEWHTSPRKQVQGAFFVIGPASCSQKGCAVVSH